MDSPKPGPQNI